MTMTDDELTEIERLANAAIAEPDVDDDTHCVCRKCTATFYVNFGSEPSSLCNGCAHMVSIELGTATPALVAEVRRLRELYKSADAGIGGLMAERDALSGEVRRLRALRDWVLNEDHEYLRRVVPRIADIVEVLYLRAEAAP